MHSHGRLVTLVDDENDAALVNSYELGASAVVSKKRPVRDLHRAVLDVAANVNTINPVAVRNAKRRLEERGHMALTRIDATDRKMLELLTKGYTDRQIASEVFLSLQTVRNACRDCCRSSTSTTAPSWHCTSNACMCSVMSRCRPRRWPQSPASPTRLGPCPRAIPTHLLCVTPTHPMKGIAPNE